MAKKKSVPANPLFETISTIVWALAIALVLRTFLFQPFHIPTGSMLPGLMGGDYIITTKYSLGYGKHAAAPLPFPVKNGRLFERSPKRGDVLVFRPEGIKKTYIKRLIGFPGDQIQMRDGRLWINGKQTESKKLNKEIYKNDIGLDITFTRWSETFGNQKFHIIYDSPYNVKYDNTTVFTVPAGHYFMMGDNRDQSLDSRAAVSEEGAGYVPISNLIGKAEFILLSVNNDFALFKPWTWANMRGSRFFKAIK